MSAVLKDDTVKNEMTSPPDRWVSCYVAAKLKHAPMILAVRKDWPKIRFAARWPLVATLESEANRPARHWQDDNLADMMTSEVVIVYAEPGDHLQNALFEAGIAWQMGKKIWLVSAKLTEDDVEHSDFKNLRGRPRVRLVSNLARALGEIARLADYQSRGGLMVFARIRKKASTRVDPLDAVADALRSGKLRAVSISDSDGEHANGPATFDFDFRQPLLTEKAWTPPEGARTFADYDMGASSRLCSNRPHVLIREDPMFGRRGYAKEVIEDSRHGFLVLVIAFRARPDHYLGWIEPQKPRDEDRMYWPPGKVEFA